METDPKTLPGALAYSRNIYERLIDWYKVADAKGQLLLTLNGVYLTAISSVLLISPQDLAKRKASLGLVSWIFLAGAAVATSISIISAIECLYSRLPKAQLDKSFFSEKAIDGSTGYRPAATFWFGTIAYMEPNIGIRMLQSADANFELSALSEQIFLLAPNVLSKHRWVNRGWAAAGVSLLFLLAAVIGVVLRA